MRQRLFAVGLAALLLATPAIAQQAGQISGLVTDSSGAVVPGATVTAVELSTGLRQSTVSREGGRYLFPSLRPTQYDLTAELSGFRTVRHKGIQLLANQSLSLNLTMAPGQLSEAIEVTGAATQVDTTTSTLNEVVDHERIVNLPLNGRDVAQLSTLVPGIVLDSTSTETGKSAPGGLRLSSNGSQDRQVSFRLDGTSNTDPYYQENQAFPFPDALQEFSIQTSNYSAVHGNNAGAVVNVVTRSGTNDLHGGVFNYLRHRAFNAKNFFSDERDHLKRNQFGGFVGGPLVKNKTFFFAGYQGTVLRNRAGDAIAFAPTAAQRAGDFSGLSAVIRDPVTGQPFPNNRIPTSRFDPAALAVLDLIPVPSSGDGRLIIKRDVAQDFNQGVLKLDHQLTDADQLSFRYFVHDFTNAGNYDESNLLTYRGGSLESAVRNQNAVASWRRNLGSSMLNEFHVGYNRVNARRAPPEGVPGMQDIGVRLPIYPTKPSIQLISVTGFFEVGTLLEATFIRDSFEFGNRTSWVKGRHNIQFGAEVQYQRVDIANEFRRASETRFNGSATGHALADFLLGRMDNFDQGTGEYKNNRVLYPSLFVQDDIRVSPRLTLNLGARYEPTPPWHEQVGRIMRFSIDDYNNNVRSTTYPNAPRGLTYRGDAGFPEDGTLGDYNNLAARVGFALDLTGDGKTSLRGGAGMFYDQHILGEFNNGAVNAPPWSLRLSLTRPSGPFSDPYRGRNDFNLITTDAIGSPTAPFPTPVLVESYDDRFDTPLTYNWNLTLEREVLSGWMARAAYVGSRSENGRRTIQLNPADPSATGATDARRIFAPAYGPINYFVQDRSSRYHGAQFSLTRRYTDGFTLSANYTLSKAVGDFGGSDGFGGELIPWNQPDIPALTWGPLDQDRRHRFVTSWVWDLSRGRDGASGAANAFLHGWQVSGIFQYQSGAPYTITSGRDNSLDGIGDDRARYTGVGTAPPDGSDKTVAFNPAAFAINNPGTFGDVGKGALRGPSHYTLDMAVVKNTRLNGRLNLQFRADAFNVLNHANFNLPNRNVSGGGFGRYTSAQDPRIVQLSVKLEF
jgi:hypothetical protein